MEQKNTDDAVVATVESTAAMIDETGEANKTFSNAQLEFIR